MAENLARLGNRAQLVSLVGDDVFGQSLRQACAAAGIGIRALATVPGQRSASHMALHGGDGDMALAVNDTDILQALTPAALDAHAALIERAACLVLDCNLGAEALQHLLTCIAARRATPVFVDGVFAVKCQRVRHCLAHVHLLKLNRLEAQTLSAMALHTAEQACAAALQLHRMGVRQVLVSLGAQGACWCDEAGRTGHWLPHPVAQVVNTSGAGDALLAGLVHGFLRGWPLAEAADFAMDCAELTLSSPTANHPQIARAALQWCSGRRTSLITPAIHQ